MNTTSIILVNYNGTNDTVECLLSLNSSTYKQYNVFLIDNGSALENFEEYLLKIKTTGKNFNRIYAISNQADSARTLLIKKHFDPVYNLNEFHDISNDSQNLILLFNENNTGFAAANNACIQLAQKLKSEYYWLLNNDTVIEKQSLNSLIHFSNKLKEKKQKPGLIGSKILYYNSDNRIQTIGGIFNPFTSRQYHKGLNENDKGQYDYPDVKIDYPYGASIFFTANFLNEVGLMNEKYFLYFEELDWAIRAKRKGFETKFCFESKVFHKQGNSTGKKMNKARSPFNACLKSRNLLLFYRQHYFALLPIAWFRLLLNAFRAFTKKDFSEAKIIMKVLFGFKNCFLVQQKT